MENKLRIAGIVKDSITDGPGIRTVIFFQGCDKDCDGCHNPESRSLDGGYFESIDSILKTIDGNPLLRGITLSGGEPLLQATEILPLVKEIKKRNLEIALYTGDIFEEITGEKLELIKEVDIVIDGPFMKSKKDLTLSFRGSSNQRIINVKESLLKNETILETSKRWNS